MPLDSIRRPAVSALAALLFIPALAAQPAPPELVWEAALSARTVAIAPDGQLVATGGRTLPNPYQYGLLDLLDAASGAVLAHRQAYGPVNEVAFSPDGQTIAAAHGGVYCAPNGGCFPDGPALTTWTVPILALAAVNEDYDGQSAVAYPPDGDALAVGNFFDNAGIVRLHDPQSLAPVQSVPGHDAIAYDVVFSPDGLRFASVGDDGFLRVWDRISGAPVYAVEHGTSLGPGGDPVSVAYSPDGTLLATGGTGREALVKVWEASTGAPVRSFPLELDGDVDFGTEQATVAFTPNGRYLAAGINDEVDPGVPEAAVRFWDLATGDLTYEIEEPFIPGRSGISDIAFSEALTIRFAYVRSGTVKMIEVPFLVSEVNTTGAEERIGSRTRVSASPNPFRESTVLHVYPDQAQHVRIEAYDMLGRMVALLHDGPLAATRAVRFDASALGPGTYVIRIVGETFTASRRITRVP